MGDLGDVGRGGGGAQEGIDVVGQGDELGVEAEVGVGQDAHEAVFIVDHGEATDVVFQHQPGGVADGGVVGDGADVAAHQVAG